MLKEYLSNERAAQAFKVLLCTIRQDSMTVKTAATKGHPSEIFFGEGKK